MKVKMECRWVPMLAEALEPLVQIMVNGERYARSDALDEERLADGDTVLFLMMMAGG